MVEGVRDAVHPGVILDSHHVHEHGVRRPLPRVGGVQPLVGQLRQSLVGQLRFVRFLRWNGDQGRSG